MTFGDCLFLCTDGVTEAMNGDRALYTDERLRQTLEPLRGQPPRELVDGVLEAVNDFVAGAPQGDDIAVMAVRFRERRSRPRAPQAENARPA